MPFPLTWFEWVNPQGGGTIGYLCEQLPAAGFVFRQFLSERTIQEKIGFPVICTFGRVRVEPAGWSAEDKTDEASAHEQAQNFLELAAGDILRLLLMINSPSNILEIGAGADNHVVDAQRARKGRPPLPNLRPIRFDVARFQQAAFLQGKRPESQSDVAEHFVRGHLKTRKNGIFWWSPHVRYQMGETPAAEPRDYEVTANRRADQNDGEA